MTGCRGLLSVAVFAAVAMACTSMDRTPVPTETPTAERLAARLRADLGPGTDDAAAAAAAAADTDAVVANAAAANAGVGEATTEPVVVELPRTSPAAAERAAVRQVRELIAGRGPNGAVGAAALRVVPPGTTTAERMVFAEARRELGDLDGAATALADAANEDARAIAPLIALARVRLAQSRAVAARTALDEAEARASADGVELHPDHRVLLGASMLLGDDPRAGERLLREELATGRNVVAAAAQLADHFVTREDHGDALAVVRAARVRDRDAPSLRALEGRLLRDLNRWEDAEAIFAALVAEYPDDPKIQYDLVLAERALGRPTEAAARLRTLLETMGARPWVVQRGEGLVGTLNELDREAAGGPRRYGAIELLAIVRDPQTDLASRVGAFRALVAGSGTDASVTRDRAVAAGLRQEAAALRVLATRALRVDATGAIETIGLLMGDADERVRGAAATRAAELAPEQAIGLVLTGMEAEESGYAFRCRHDALRKLAEGAGRHGTPDLAWRGEDDSATRRTTFDAWRVFWNQ